jgi:hypothetical protein
VQQEHGSEITAGDLEEAMSIHGMGPALAKKLFRHSIMVAENPHHDPAESFDLHPSEAGTTRFGACIKERDYAEPAPNTAVTMAIWPKAKAQHGLPTGRETSLAVWLISPVQDLGSGQNRTVSLVSCVPTPRAKTQIKSV